MKERFQIEDLMSQGPGGIVFRATDAESGRMVALRRYFPFGKGCGGLDEDARTAYAQSLDGLSSLKHESLRQVLGGGCDEVDHLPFIATEWVDGETIEMLVARSLLDLDDVAHLLKGALDATLWLSQIFQKESLWIETELSTVILRDSGKPRDFTFWISPVKWLGVSGPDHDLKLLAGFASQLLQGLPRAMGDARHAGLVRWIEWLRTAPKSATLTQARDKLALHLQSSAQAPIRKAPPANGKPVAARKPRRKVAAMLWVNLFLLIGTLGLAHYAYEVKQTRAESRKSASNADSKPKKTSKKKSAPRTEIVAGANESAKDEVIAWDNNNKLMENIRRQVIVEGPAGRIDQSKSGKTLYFVFNGGDKPDSARVGIRLGKESPDRVKSELSSFVGKKIRAQGVVKKEMQGDLSSPAIMINDVSAIQIID